MITRSFASYLFRIALIAVCLSSATMAESVSLPAKVAHFEDTLRSGLVDTARKDLAERMQRWTGFLREQTARISEGSSEPGVLDQHVQNALMSARAINRGMISHGFSAAAQNEWQAIRLDLNRIAAACGRPPIPDVVLLTRVSPADPLVDRPGVREAMQKIEAAVDDLKGALGSQWSSVFGNIQRPAVEHWVADLEDTTDGMLSQYKQKRVPDFYFRVEESLMIAAGLNPIVDNGSSGALAAKWRNLRSLLNQLARTFAYPPLDANAIPQR